MAEIMLDLSSICKNDKLISKIHRIITKKLKGEFKLFSASVDGDFIRIWSYVIKHTSLGIFLKNTGSMWLIFDYRSCGDRGSSSGEMPAKVQEKVIRLIRRASKIYITEGK